MLYFTIYLISIICYIVIYIISNKIKLGGGPTANNWLIFDYAYSGYSSAYEDGLRIEVSKDCGNTWDSIYGAIGPDLQTTNYVAGPWHPTCGSWQTDSISLSDFGLNSDTIMIRFVAINDYGNRFFMDNVKVNGQNILSLEEKEKSHDLKIYPNPTNGMLNIKTNLLNSEINIIDISGRLVRKKQIKKHHTIMNVKNIKDGFYILRISNGYDVEERKLIIRNK